MESAEAGRAEKQHKLAGIMDSMGASKGKLEESRSSLERLKEQVRVPGTRHTCNVHTLRWVLVYSLGTVYRQRHDEGGCMRRSLTMRRARP